MTTPKKRSRSKEAAEQRREKLAALNVQLEEYEEQLEPGQRAAILARFAGYSDRNALLIASQRPVATEVHGYREWQSLGRQVRKGETGIQILAPAGTSADKAGTDATDAGEDGEKIRQFFRVAHVFDISQTDPIGTSVGRATEKGAGQRPEDMPGAAATGIVVDDETCAWCEKPLNDGCDCCIECDEHHDDCTCSTCPGCHLCWHCYTHDSSSAGCASDPDDPPANGSAAISAARQHLEEMGPNLDRVEDFLERTEVAA